ncbi:hypothetical protein, unlikely [Trypanosoma brucei gambiense DAL972]|uniref:Uncharacterized protein n=1 Tax=Trypanosoma brucei gambiense (strain MHOM/CI/86/DAL972) TaxID=679716 RepID=C9ZL25_TRYB9|nr:hypothetical protein, unlikely [Trypanosoma brucei gambiense DAL972]CBH10034.1 hypothetical protein, unlikely [Trypanosoma brucei gambiense DAL972]|eukprot:XP_011772324.1 hypothetical protein, unlikely [Trypanosoma brucei gambiense DAL972]
MANLFRACKGGRRGVSEPGTRNTCLYIYIYIIDGILVCNPQQAPKKKSCMGVHGEKEKKKRKSLVSFSTRPVGDSALQHSSQYVRRSPSSIYMRFCPPFFLLVLVPSLCFPYV